MERVEATDYYDLSAVSDPEISPDGERVAYVVRTPGDAKSYRATVHLARLGGGEPRQLTADEGEDEAPRFGPGGERLVFASDRGDYDTAQLRLLPLDGGESRRVTAVPGAVSDVTWAPDGSRIAFTQSTTAAERETETDLDCDPDYEREPPDPRVVDRTVYRADGRYFDGTRRHVYVLDLERECVERITDGERDVGAPAWGDGDTLYWTVARGEDPDDSAVYGIEGHDLPTGETETLTRTTGWDPAIAATPAGRIAYVRVPETNLAMRQAEVDVYDRETGETATLTAGLDRTVGDLGIEWDPEGEWVYFLTPDEGSVVLRRADRECVETVLGGDRHVDGFAVGRDAVAVTHSEWDHPGDVVAATPGGAEEVRLTRVNADYLAGRAVREPEELRFESEGTVIQGWVLTPPDLDPDASYPLAVEVHGGPHATWSPAGTMWHEFQTLAARGYVVFWCNPRGSTGYGEDFATAIKGDWGAVTLRDVLAGADRVAQREYVDADAQFLTGGSFGGFLTGWAVGHTDRFRGAVAQRGVYHLASFYGTSDAYRLVEWDFEATPWTDPVSLWEQSPMAYADEVETPTLLLHSEDDYRVPVSEAETFYRYLRKNGVETRLVRYPREGHELSRSGEPGHVVDRIERLCRWFDGYSPYHDAPPALERDPAAGLSGAGETDDEADGRRYPQ
jgi:dipeptidyl aminopeptidase/acylaminoacyl peptidase